MVKAVINGERVECGKCGTLLAMIEKNPRAILSAGRELPQLRRTQIVEDRLVTRLAIKCKHKASGKTCNEINEILL